MLEQFALQAWEHIVFFRLEILGAAFLIGLEILRRKHKDNKVIAAFVRFMQEQIIEQMKAANVADKSDTPGGRRKMRRAINKKIRKEAKKARKVNRGSGKGSKTSQ
jgi:hypothetical protein